MSRRSIAGTALAIALAVASIGGSARAADAPKTEGTVVWYATMNTKDLEATAQAFMSTHPGITVQTLRVGSSELPARVITEQRGGKFNADAISGDEFQVAQLVAAGAFQPYRSPQSKAFLKGTVEANGYWTNLYQNTTVLAWNPVRLRADHLKPPASLADFAKPEWKGRFAIDAGALNWYIGTLQYDKNGDELMRRIAANAPMKTSGHTVTVTQLEAGEYDATPTAYGYLADGDEREGKPVAYANPRPLLVSLNPLGMAKNAPHPAAARVLIDWLLSHDGQQFIAMRGGGEISSRADVRNNPRVWDPKAPFVIIRAPDPQKYNDAVRNFRRTFGIAG